MLQPSLLELPDSESVDCLLCCRGMALQGDPWRCWQREEWQPLMRSFWWFLRSEGSLLHGGNFFFSLLRLGLGGEASSTCSAHSGTKRLPSSSLRLALPEGQAEVQNARLHPAKGFPELLEIYGGLKTTGALCQQNVALYNKVFAEVLS